MKQLEISFARIMEPATEPEETEEKSESKEVSDETTESDVKNRGVSKNDVSVTNQIEANNVRMGPSIYDVGDTAINLEENIHSQENTHSNLNTDAHLQTLSAQGVYMNANEEGLSMNHNINKENTEIDGYRIKEARGGDELHQRVDSHEQAGDACDDPGLEDVDAKAAQGDGQAEVYQEGRGPELHQRVDRLGVQVQGDGLEGDEQHPCVGGQPRVRLETVKLRKRKGMPRDGLVQAGISNFVLKFPSLGLARGVVNGEKNLSGLGDKDVLAGK